MNSINPNPVNRTTGDMNGDGRVNRDDADLLNGILDDLHPQMTNDTIGVTSLTGESNYNLVSGQAGGDGVTGSMSEWAQLLDVNGDHQINTADVTRINEIIAGNPGAQAPVLERTDAPNMVHSRVAADPLPLSSDSDVEEMNQILESWGLPAGSVTADELADGSVSYIELVGNDTSKMTEKCFRAMFKSDGLNDLGELHEMNDMLVTVKESNVLGEDLSMSEVADKYLHANNFIELDADEIKNDPDVQNYMENHDPAYSLDLAGVYAMCKDLISAGCPILRNDTNDNGVKEVDLNKLRDAIGSQSERPDVLPPIITHPTPVVPTPVAPTPVVPTPVVPTPVVPTPVVPTPVVPTPVVPTPVVPTPVVPTPVVPTPVVPTPVVPDPYGGGNLPIRDGGTPGQYDGSGNLPNRDFGGTFTGGNLTPNRDF
ncbi:MAG: hypothetical protein WC838_04005 [Candidatus Margulisiibacteriota bacterium]|jgi:hypothetical protein